MALRYLIILALLTFALPAAAAIDCRIVASMSRLTDLPTTAARWPPGGLPPPITQNELRMFDASNVTFAFRGSLNPQQNQQLAQFANATAQLSNLVQRGDAAAMQSTLKTPETIRLFSAAAAILQQFDCDGPNVAHTANATPGPAAADTASTQQTDPAASNARAFALPPVWVIIVVLAIIVIIGCGTLLIAMRRRESSRRRARRFSLNQIVKFSVKETNAFGRILDISCVGVKLRHYGQLKSGEAIGVDIELGGQWYQGTLNWANEHYAGLAFAPPLKLPTLLLILSGVHARDERDVRNAKNETAPQGTPSHGQV